MGVSVYDPTRRTRSQLPARARPRDDEEEERPGSLGLISPGARAARAATEPGEMAVGANVGRAPSKPDDTRPWYEKGFGFLVNNPVTKTVLQPLDLIGVPQRAIASTVNEVVDLAQGEGFSFQDLYDQTNPFYFAHGENLEDSIGMGDVLQNATNGKGLGNEWLDRVAGFTGDVLTDPLTYLGGIGVLDKGLDAARQGTRLGAALQARKVGQGAAKTMAGSPAWQAKRLATSEGAARGSRAALSGRSTRMTRTAQARELINQADADVLADLYTNGARSGERFRNDLLEGIQTRAGRGLGVRIGDEAVDEALDTALNIRSPQMRLRRPFGGQGVEIGGARLAEGLQSGFGSARLGINNSRLGRQLTDSRSPLDVEKAVSLQARGERLPDALKGQLDQAARVIVQDETRRPLSGLVLNIGQRGVRQKRKQMLDEIEKFGGRSAYIQATEEGVDTTLAELFRWMRNDVAGELGITIPKLDNYVPHVMAREFVEKLSADQAFASSWLDRFGLTQSDLQSEGGRLAKRNLQPDQDITVVVDDVPVTFNTGRGTVADINAAAADVGLGRVLEDDPLNLIDQYVQGMSEDLGRRAARAEMIALNPDAQFYDPRMALKDPSRIDEWTAEQQAAVKRLQRQGRTDADIGGIPTQDQIEGAQAARTARQQQDEIFAEAQDMGYRPTDVRQTLDEINAGQELTTPELDRVARNLGDVDRVAIEVDRMLGEWAMENTAQGVMQDPIVQAMLKNFKKEVREPNALRRAYDYGNRYFKTFAVLTPGFHVRNWLSALFMNAADAVPFKTSMRGMAEWKKFISAIGDSDDLNAGLDYLRKLEETQPMVRQAFDAVFGSGAGGRFTESGVAEGVHSGRRFADWWLENRATRASQDLGATVEGSIRMGMALDTLEKGGSIAEATARITRIHFDYSQTSRFDEKAKRFAPFWSFFSRNIPMQVMQMWGRPGAYLRYEHFRDNFADPEAIAGLDGPVPGYIEDGRGIPMSLGPFNWFEPDLPHTRVYEDVERLGNASENPLGMLSNVTPVISAPMEYMFGKDAFTGQEIGKDDFSPMNWLDASNYAALLPALATGNLRWGAGGPWINDRVTNAITSIDPNIARAERLTGQGNSGSDRLLEAWVRTFGGPVRTITDNQAQGAEFGDRLEAERQAMLRALIQYGE